MYIHRFKQVLHGVAVTVFDDSVLVRPADLSMTLVPFSNVRDGSTQRTIEPAATRFGSST